MQTANHRLILTSERTKLNSTCRTREVWWPSAWRLAGRSASTWRRSTQRRPTSPSPKLILHRRRSKCCKSAPPSERARCFFRLWTLKEAYIKAIGKGLSAPLNSFAFTFEPIRIAFLPGLADDASNWRFSTLPASDRHVLSIAANRPDGEALDLTTRALSPRDL